MATNHKLVKEISDQFLHCKICLEPFKNPKTLSCLHTFCVDCLQQHLDSESTRSRFASLYNRHVTCPLCRTKTEIPTGGIRRLPDNFLLSNLTEIIDRRRPSKIPPCEICHLVRTRSNEACSKCLDCSKLLCKSCVELHLTTKVTQHHSLIDVEGEKDIECKVHPEENVRFYCEPCDTCICIVCTFQEHRDHEICSFNEGYAKYKSSLEALLDASKNRLELVQERMGMIHKCETAIKETRESIRDLAISYIQQVRSTEKELLKKVDTYFGDKVVGFLENREWLQENLDQLQSACNLTDIIMRDKGVEMLLLKREMQNRLNSLLAPDLPNMPDDIEADLKFIPGKVTFGTLSVLQDSDENHNSEICENHVLVTKVKTSTADTQTDIYQLVDATTTMMNDTTRTMKHSLVQTQKSVTNNKEVNTDQTYSQNNINDVYDSKNVQNIRKSTSDVGLNTQSKSMESKCLQVYTETDCNPGGICFKCSEEIQSDPGKLGVCVGEAPKVQDIIILNTVDKDGKEWRRRRRHLIKSRRVQTEISSLSSSGDSLDDLLSPNLRHVPERSVSDSGTETFGNRLIEFRSVASDPIGFEETNSSSTRTRRRRMRDKITMTSFESTQVIEKRDASTFTYPSRLREFGTNTKVDQCEADTQTLPKRTYDQGVATDYAGQSDKTTTTPIVTVIDNGTTMPLVSFENKVTWTDILQTSERAMCTDVCDTCESSTEMSPLQIADQGLQVQPEMLSRDTNTNPVKCRDQSLQVSTDEQTRNLNGKITDGPMLSDLAVAVSPAVLEKTFDDASTETNNVTCADKETGTINALLVDQWTITPSPVLINTGVSPARPATRDTGIETTHVSFMDQSTYTETKHFKDAAVETLVIVQDNETLTEKIKLQDAQTFVDVETQNSETSTDQKIMIESFVCTDANWLEQLKPEMTSASTEMLASENKEIATNTDIVGNADVSTSINSDDLVSRVEKSTDPIKARTTDRGTMALSFGQTSTCFIDMDTQTSEISLYDKCVSTSRDLNDKEPRSIEYCDMATSTESLPYIGLLSELEGDELFLIPESAFDLVNSEASFDENGEPVEMVDDGTATDFVPIIETSTQTLISSAWNEDEFVLVDTDETSKREKDGKVLVNVGVNTMPKVTFEKETSTPIRHLFSKGTMTFYIAKTDKSTSTFNNTRHIAETVFGNKSHAEKSSKVTMTQTSDLVDASTVTDNSQLDGKMAACISKLRNVSERLQSPTCKSPPDYPWKSMTDSGSSAENFLLMPEISVSADRTSDQSLRQSSDEERRKNILDLVAQSENLLKPKEARQDYSQVRKAQPITTLKGKLLAPPNNDTEQEKSKSLPRQYTTDHNGATVKMGSQLSPPSRLPLLRYNSAPGRIATVPNQSVIKKGIQTNQKSFPPSKIPVSQKPNPEFAIPSPEFYSPQIKSKLRGGLPAITETRPQSTGSDSDASSYVSAASSQSSTDVAGDLMSLKINSATARLSPIPFTSVPEETEESYPDKPLPPVKKDGGNVGFMHKLFSKKKKNAEPPKQPQTKDNTKTKPFKPVPVEQPKPKSPKPPKKRPFVYIRQRYFSIQHDNEDDRKQSKADKKEKESKRKSDCSLSSQKSGEDSRPQSTYDNL